MAKYFVHCILNLSYLIDLREQGAPPKIVEYSSTWYF